MFYQVMHSLNADGIKFEVGIDFSFPTHLHDDFELITVTEGEMEVTIDRHSYHLTAGDAVLVFPNQVHALETHTHSRHFLCIFSPKLVRAYSLAYQSSVPESNLYPKETLYIRRLAEASENTPFFVLKGLLYAICGEFDRCATYVERTKDKDSLLLRIFDFVAHNFDKDCSLDALARETFCHYVYLSRHFRACTGIAFTDYVIRYRVTEACYLLRNSEKSILETAYACGFGSLRSFNRNFKSILGMTPHEYKSYSRRESDPLAPIEATENTAE